jgi:hypothetical protein
MVLSYDCVKMADTHKKSVTNCFICNTQRYDNFSFGVKSVDMIENISFLSSVESKLLIT